MKYTFIIFMIFFFTDSYSQIKNMYPVMGEVPDLSIERQQEYKQYKELQNRMEKGEIIWEDMSETEQEIFADNELRGVWDIIGNGDNWYDNAGPYKIIASSHLEAYKGITYVAKNAHDHSYKTAWVEGKTDYGIGQSLTYFFENESPRVTSVHVINGYVKSDKAWKDNSRVKQLKMYINGVAYAYLNLKDTKAEQIFKFEPLGQRSDGKELILKFEITDVYKGGKYSDTVITELYFQGIDVY